MSEEKEVNVLVEMRVRKGLMSQDIMSLASSSIKVPNFELDTSYEPVPLEPTPDLASDVEAKGEEVVLVRGKINKDKIKELEKQPNVVKVWMDTEIQPFSSSESILELTSEAMAPCPIPPCDCSPATPKGTINDVANYLGVNQIWADGIKGNGVVVGVVDGGIKAIGRVADGEIANVIDGWPNDWGTIANWGKHGHMCATDVLGMAPDAKIYDLRISSGSISGTISNAIAAYNWAINKHRTTGKPDILTNSWGIFQKAWDPDYATNPNHPFTRKVVQAIKEGIIVLFAAGNCGGTCPDRRCGSDTGSGKSIWG
ncbi:MAG: serine protease, partial [Candidatus Nitrosothermus koennekii]